MTTKRSFSFDASALPESDPLLDTGIYSGVVKSTTIANANKQHITFVKEVVKKEETGEYLVGGSLYFTMQITSKKAINVLQRDTPTFTGGIRLKTKFNEEKGVFELIPTKQLGGVLAALGLKDMDFISPAQSDFVWNDDIEIPEEVAHLSYAVALMNSIEFYRILFGMIGQAMVGIPANVKIIRRQKWNDPTTQENQVNQGQYGDEGGLLPYNDGDENDLGD
jgi:hypothetical protein